MKAPTRTVFANFDPSVASAPSPAAARAAHVHGLAPVAGLLECRACEARPEALQVVAGEGPADAALMVLGQNPGEEEDASGRPFMGEAGAVLDGWLSTMGLDRSRIFVTYVVKCHTHNNRVPRTTEIRACSNQWLLAELHALPQLKAIIPLGKSAVDRILGKNAPPMTPPTVYHYRLKILERELHVLPLPHPAFVLRAPHYALTFTETLIPQVRETLQQLLPEVYDRSRRL